MVLPCHCCQLFPMSKRKLQCSDDNPEEVNHDDNPKGSKIRKTSRSFDALPLALLKYVFAFTDYRDRETHMLLSKEIAAIIGHVFGISKTIRPAALYQLWVQHGAIPTYRRWKVVDFMCPVVKTLPLEIRQALQLVKILTLAGNLDDLSLSEYPNGVYFKLRGMRIPNEMGSKFDGKCYKYEEIKFIDCNIHIDLSILFLKCPLLQLITCINSRGCFAKDPSLRETRSLDADGNNIVVITRV